MWRGLKFGIPYDFSSTSLHNIMLFRNFSLSGASVVPSPLKVVSWCWYDKMQQAFCEVWACFPISEVKYTYMDILQSSKSCQKTFYLPTIFRTAGHTDFFDTWKQTQMNFAAVVMQIQLPQLFCWGQI